MSLGQVTTAAGSAQTVDINTTGAASNNLMLVASSSTNDNWTLNSAGGIAFNGNTSLTAASASLTAAGAITGGTATTAINTSAANGPIVLDGASLGTAGSPLGVLAGTAPLRQPLRQRSRAAATCTSRRLGHSAWDR